VILTEIRSVFSTLTKTYASLISPIKKTVAYISNIGLC